MTTTKATITNGNIYISGSFSNADDKTVLLCDQLPISGIGNTPQEAMRVFFECLATYVQSASDLGKLDETLRDHKAIVHNSAQKWGGFTLTMPTLGVLDDEMAEAI